MYTISSGLDRRKQKTLHDSRWKSSEPVYWSKSTQIQSFKQHRGSSIIKRVHNRVLQSRNPDRFFQVIPISRWSLTTNPDPKRYIQTEICLFIK